ncbi:MAG: flagellar filament capping protein FliD [Sedimentisphaerales bacterium]|nr:flagellar filament capping protein FliD [Sedimentisphaerales bacterium]
MSTTQLSGLSTGIDTEQLIAQLMAVEQRTMDLYTARKETWDDRKEALNTLETKLSNLRSSIRDLSDADELKAFSASSSDSDVVTAEASYNSFEGNHNVVVNQLATSERWVQKAGLEYAEDYVGEGTFIYSYNNKETSITTTETTTLEELVGLINNDANNPGITASMLYYNKAYHLVLNGNDAGTDYRISVNSSNTQILEADSEFTEGDDNATLSTRIIDLDQFGENSLEGGEVIEITGTDHNGNAIAQVNISVTSNTKLSHIIDEINDAFDGIARATFENGKIILTDKACGDSDLSINISYNANGSAATLSLPSMAITDVGGSMTSSLANFDFSDFTQTQVAKDSLIKVDGFPTDSAVSEVQTISRSPSPGSGTYTITYEGQTTTEIAYNASPAEIQAALEALSTVNTGDITVDGSANGLDDGDVTFTFNNILGDVSMISVNGANLGPASSPVTVAETTKGVPAYISRSSNTIDDVIHGVTLHLHDTTNESGEEITLTRDIESVKTKVQSMVEAYNQAVTFIKENTAYDTSTKEAGILMADYTVSSIKSQIRTPLIAQTSGFIEDIDSFLIPAQIGFEVDKDGVLSLDMNVFDEAIAEDYMSVLALIGANKNGSSNSNTIEYYGASSKYTTAGNYDVQVTVSGGAITSARIKLSGESTYRNATFSGNIITGVSTFDDNGDPINPENSLQLSVDLSQDGTFNANVRVKQGFAGAMEDSLDRILKNTSGSIQIDRENVKDQIELLEDKIELEEYRLEKKEEHLKARFARLEKTLTLLQNQMAALGFSS